MLWFSTAQNLTLYYGRTIDNVTTIIPVDNYVTLHLDSPLDIKHFLECESAVSGPETLEWEYETREFSRFPTLIVGGRQRLDLSPSPETGLFPVSRRRLGIYSCRAEGGETASVDVTGG